MDQKKAIAKIKKCLALAKSSNANEAAAAMRQAQALMKEYDIDNDMVELADVSAEFVKAGNAQRPAQYLGMLISTIKKAFGVDVVYHTSTMFGRTEAQVEFIGVNPQPELASYAFDVLRRQLNRDRTAYIKTLKRYKPANKTRKADLFCEAWVVEVFQQVNEFTHSAKHQELIAKYKSQKYSDELGTVSGRENKYKRNDDDAWYAGSVAGSKAELNKAAGADQRIAIEQG